MDLENYVQEIVSIFMEGQDPSASPRSPHRQRRRISHPHDHPMPPFVNYSHPHLLNSNPSGNFSYPPMQPPFNFMPPSMMPPQRAQSIDATSFYESQENHYPPYFRAPIEQDIKSPHSPFLQTTGLPIASNNQAPESQQTIERVPLPKVERLSHSPTPPETPQQQMTGILTTKQTSTQPPSHSDVSYRIIPTIPQRKGEKMIFYLALIGRDGSVAKEFNDECHINPTAYEDATILQAALYTDFKLDNGKIERLKLQPYDQPRRVENSVFFKDGQATIHLNISVTRRGLSSKYSNINKPVRIYVQLELLSGGRVIGSSELSELPYKNGKAKREAAKQQMQQKKATDKGLVAWSKQEGAGSDEDSQDL